MNTDIYIVLGIIAFSLIAFTFEIVRSDLVAISVMSLLILTGLLTPEEATKGFSSSAALTVACMFIISSSFVNAGLVEVAGRLLSKWNKVGPRTAMFAIMVIVGVLSAFINNTAAVAVFIPIAIKLAQISKISRKQFLMPLSFAAIFGGTCTLIGTSTNILVNSVYVGRGFPGFGMFEFSSIGIVLSLVGFVYMLTVGKILLSSPRPSVDTDSEDSYFTEVIIQDNSPSIGVPLMSSPLYRDFRDNIASMKRNGEPVFLSSDPVLQKEDTFVLICSLEKIISLRKRIGISILDSKVGTTEAPTGYQIYEVVVPANSDIVGEAINNSHVLRAQGIILLAKRHRSRTLFSFLQRSRIQAGDVLVIAAKSEFFADFRNEERLILISETKSTEVAWLKMGISTFFLVGLIVASSFGYMPILGAALVVTAGLILTRTISLKEAYAALDAQVLILLSCILSLGFALEKTGAAAMIAEIFVTYGGTYGPYVIVSALYISTSLMTEVMSNNATAVLMAPVALDVARAMSMNEKPFLVAIILAGSASFMTPVGYQTNTLIYAPGGYKVSDFLKVGTPLNLIFWTLSTFLIPFFFPFQ